MLLKADPGAAPCNAVTTVGVGAPYGLAVRFQTVLLSQKTSGCGDEMGKRDPGSENKDRSLHHPSTICFPLLPGLGQDGSGEIKPVLGWDGTQKHRTSLSLHPGISYSSLTAPYTHTLHHSSLGDFCSQKLESDFWEIGLEKRNQRDAEVRVVPLWRWPQHPVGMITALTSVHRLEICASRDSHLCTSASIWSCLGWGRRGFGTAVGRQRSLGKPSLVFAISQLIVAKNMSCFSGLGDRKWKHLPSLTQPHRAPKSPELAEGHACAFCI